jgi:acetyltransferase-like isoleucine patch superfamily enzyme
MGHDCKMLKFSSLGPNVTAGGYVTIGEFSAICIGATIKDRVNIGNHSIIGAGTLLLKDCEDNVVMYGTPAQKIRKRKIGENYL